MKTSTEIWNLVAEGAHERIWLTSKERVLMEQLLLTIAQLKTDAFFRAEEDETYRTIGRIIGCAYESFGSEELMTDLPCAYMTHIIGFNAANYICSRVSKEAYLFRMDRDEEYCIERLKEIERQNEKKEETEAAENEKKEETEAAE